MNKRFPYQRSAAVCQRTNPLGDAGRSAPFLPRRGRSNYPKPHHLLIASLCCWAVVVILIGVILI